VQTRKNAKVATPETTSTTRTVAARTATTRASSPTQPTSTITSSIKLAAVYARSTVCSVSTRQLVSPAGVVCTSMSEICLVMIALKPRFGEMAPKCSAEIATPPVSAVTALAKRNALSATHRSTSISTKTTRVQSVICSKASTSQKMESARAATSAAKHAQETSRLSVPHATSPTLRTTLFTPRIAPVVRASIPAAIGSTALTAQSAIPSARHVSRERTRAAPHAILIRLLTSTSVLTTTPVLHADLKNRSQFLLSRFILCST